MVLMHLVHGETEAQRAQVAAGPALGMTIMNINGDQHVLWGPTRVMGTNACYGDQHVLWRSNKWSNPSQPLPQHSVGCD